MIFEEKRYVMIKPIMKDEAFLAIKSVPATKMDTQVAQDLKDTLQAYSDQCVGMAANMIGVSKNIIIFALPNGKPLTRGPVAQLDRATAF